MEQNYRDKFLEIAKEIVLAKVSRDNHTVFLFGSQANGLAKTRSDIDIGFWGSEPLSPKIKFEIEEELEASSVPYSIDLVDFFYVDEKFRSLALKNAKIWQAPSNINLN